RFSRDWSSDVCSSDLTPFGTCLIASTKKGICHLAFSNNPAEALLVLKSQFEYASYIEQADDFHQSALACFNPQTTNPIQRIKLRSEERRVGKVHRVRE